MYQHKAAVHRKAERRIVIETGGHFDYKVTTPSGVTILDVAISGRLIKEQLPWHRRKDFIPGVRDQARFHTFSNNLPVQVWCQITQRQDARRIERRPKERWWRGRIVIGVTHAPRPSPRYR
jgi:hypothetical protein